MPRVVKHPDFRRNEILECARQVFLSRGYENASLNDVIAEAGISKGAFYHYYSSKEELLAALAEGFARSAYEAVQDVFHAEGLDPLARLNAFVERSWRLKLEAAPANWKLFKAFYRPENLALHQRVTVASAALFRPALTGLISDGVESGAFETFDPEGVAELLLQLPASTHAILAQAILAPGGVSVDAVVATLEKRLRLYGVAVDRTLGLPDGSVPLANSEYLRRLLAIGSKVT